jgi:hypothetical protein
MVAGVLLMKVTERHWVSRRTVLLKIRSRSPEG